MLNIFKAVSSPTLSKPGAKSRNISTSVHHLCCTVISGDPPSFPELSVGKAFLPPTLLTTQVFEFSWPRSCG